MTQSRYTASARGTLPWSGPRKDGATYGRAEIPGKYPGPLGALHERRTVEQLEEILAERLAELRARPPVGYPHPGVPA
jgi:hypothetical protein